MKRLTAIFLLVAMLVTMTACGTAKNDPTTEPTVNTTEGQKDPTTNPTVDATEAPVVDATEETTGDATEAPTEEPTEAPTTEPTEAPTTEPTQAPTEAPAAKLEGTLEELIGKLIEAQPVEFMGGCMPIDLTDKSEDGLWFLSNYTGLSSAESITEAAFYESMIGSIAYSLVMVRVAEGKDAKTVAQTMKDNINPRKWICVGADQIMVAGYGDVVMFIMLDSGLGLSAQSYVDAFTALCGGKVDFSI